MNRFNLYAPIYDSFMKLFKLYYPKLIIKNLNPNKNQRILDLGGGTGYIAHFIVPHAQKVVLLDSSKKMLQKAEKYKGLELCCAPAQKIPYPDNYFDSIICIDALHHIKDIEACVNEIRRVLKNNGRLIILEFNVHGFFGMLFWLFEKIYIDNSRFINSQELEALLTKNNFKGKTIMLSQIQYLYTGEKND